MINRKRIISIIQKRKANFFFSGNKIEGGVRFGCEEFLGMEDIDYSFSIAEVISDGLLILWKVSLVSVVCIILSLFTLCVRLF